ncbi:VanZ family protein [Streptomyces sp. NPDC101115]|uniref:VanZ family protein n=1 Tax=Streptomyces sp. NPDC101115 TaxID=3366106 RepID=UPI003809F294
MMWQLVLYVNPLSVTLFLLGCAVFAVVFTRWLAFAPPEHRKVARRFLVGGLVIVLLATVVPTQPIGSGGRYVSLVPGAGILGPGIEGMYPMERRMALATSVANAAMFVPLGVFWYSARGRGAGLRVLAGLFSVSVLIELSQLLTAAGRVVDIDDVILNTSGGLVGLLMAAVSARLPVRAARKRRHAAVTRAR